MMLKDFNVPKKGLKKSLGPDGIPPLLSKGIAGSDQLPSFKHFHTSN